VASAFVTEVLKQLGALSQIHSNFPDTIGLEKVAPSSPQRGNKWHSKELPLSMPDARSGPVINVVSYLDI
jgi:hypothetical protein